MTDKLTTINPATEETLNTYDRMSDKEAFAAVERCHEAFLQWRHRSLEDRAAIIRNIGKELRAGAEEFAQLMTSETGKLIGDGAAEVELCAAICDYTAATGVKALADEEREVDGARAGIVTYSPIGVVYGIQPWNFPAYQAVRYSIASLMAGNGILLKHAEACTGSGLFLKELYERAGLPEGLFTVLLIDHDQSDRIIENDLVRGVTLTGSEGAGRHVGEVAGRALKKTVLELGSNDAYLVLEDADLDIAVEHCVKGRIFNNGETCVNAKRFIVTDKVYDAFVERFVDQMAAIKMGDPMDDDTDLGPMAREDLRDTLADQVEKSVKNGARIRCGGEVPDRKGFYYPSTVLDNVEPGQPAYDDELFGPVASVIRAKDDEDAMRIANDSRYGLGGGIFSKDEDKAITLARDHFDTGMIFINGFSIATPTMPFGGVKNSGYGREHGGFGMKEFVNAKAITVF
ncbi:NAD-dependent succinate-semialdehyde dehydrogenase [Aquisalinus flavus]|uniref:Succinate-semialdehyde dehydrogenase n=1 Tax=Aquisalinus flavus TaxID=1526572 RepID=A0A8J2V3N2_9PROT|nr:NAD-dependent succinate-semialdehyde dehydrogenase [Aquisalinus flavus]MBD0427028.1 NAD-dependent succinate-semialdehyde dehydrogenase [Aquisalinus flavus]UNE46854.1 NAD-dependent succinate-semialdehyde dehydrogenase [Aquisalinus flavus]GGC97796.1 succinate-semialdehyde dehydrogenase [Aquisalinus flavus]